MFHDLLNFTFQNLLQRKTSILPFLEIAISSTLSSVFFGFGFIKSFWISASISNATEINFILRIIWTPRIVCHSTGVAKNNSHIRLKDTHIIIDRSPRHPCPILCDIWRVIQADKVRPIWNVTFVWKKLIKRTMPKIEDNVWINQEGVSPRK